MKVTKMQLFFLDLDPVESAKYYINAHVIKIAVEVTQMLYAVHYLAFADSDETPSFPDISGIIPEKHYRKTHSHHPMTIWASMYPENYEYMIRAGLSLCEEYEFRYGRKMKPVTNLRYLQALGFPKIGPNITLPDTRLTAPGPDRCSPVPLCFEKEYAVKKTGASDYDLVLSYREYYRSKKGTLKIPMRWGDRGEPGWFSD